MLPSFAVESQCEAKVGDGGHRTSGTAPLRFDAVLTDEAPEAWRGQLDQHVFRGASFINEVVFFHPPTRTLILTDLAFNVAADRTSGARLFYWLVGAAGRFGPHRFVRLTI